MPKVPRNLILGTAAAAGVIALFVWFKDHQPSPYVGASLTPSDACVMPLDGPKVDRSC